MNYVEFENFLKQAIGLDSASVGPASVERAVQDRRSAGKIKDVHAYWNYLTSSEAELQALIEAVVVRETWFFRDREAFVALVRMLGQARQRARPDNVLRLLSLPCATGEEPYSIAMALLDGGFAPNSFQIDAIDISEQALAVAERGVYGKNSFRGQNLEFRDRHFEITPDGHRVSDAVRAQVRFQHGNIVAPGFLPGREIYDVVFCRNVLIYFNRTTQDRVIAILERLLLQTGALFVGPSETGVVLTHDFVSAKTPLAFAFYKRSHAPPEIEPKTDAPMPHRAAPRRAARPNALPAARTARPTPPGRTRQKAAPAETGIRPEDDFADIARLADQGRLAEAAQLCEAHVRKHGASAQAFYLLGLIRDADGDMLKAALHYRKALYLDQTHQETLSHLALLLERQGNTHEAQLLRRRMGRIASAGAK